MAFTRAHRLLTATVVCGAVTIAGIGFAGSYAAVRELALHKGFGKFSYILPIGIDAGICVLLALDLLLTWIRIPFPLLRQTAWLLTAATIAFNGAAAWPDPLGVGMHGVIPILFVVCVEAARHAIGRIADITADKHMEGIRLTRWLLSPVPTFLLWRRMKLWELRSYEQAIQLEQERLVYQTQLRSRFGRGWRRKAPVESLMPLRLARYGVPLTKTAPSGLAAAGIEPGLAPAAPRRQTEPERAEAPAPAPAQKGPAAPPAKQRHPQPNDDGYPAPEQEHAQEPEPSPRAAPPRQETVYEGSYGPSHMPDPSHVPEEQYEQQSQPYEPSPQDTDRTPTPDHPDTTHPSGMGSPPAQEPEAPPPAGEHSPQEPAPAPRLNLPDQTRTTPEKASMTKEPEDSTPAPAPSQPTTVDRYYLAWHTFTQQHGHEPQGNELSHHLAEHNIVDRAGEPIKPKALTRYFLEFRIYTAWAEHRAHTPNPPLDKVAHDLAQRGIRAQYNKPVRAIDLVKFLAGFERRWNTLNHHNGATRPH
ncbi:DUF2637 domain-containing protein [Streptomyces sp. V4I2]|uniref:DUF2637 domain-containing protein n=1 Tax=Streptomyces sp. V4I2 TaxID=3042280 RepID=UPI00278396DD|nr:DUF2637 domain-containing protein [Streptomyces sp. V4I2]MDQ1041876.1 hypothetical protein [Streptomyces sp. V4I2]